LAYVALAWQSVYGNLYTDLSEYFLEPYASDLPALFNGINSGSTINAALPSLTADFAQPDLLTTLLEPGNPFLLAAEDNNVHDWAPQAPTRLYYCTEDEQVYFENALVAQEAMTAAGAPNVQAINLGPYDHSGCAGQAIFGAALWFSQLATVCELWSVNDLAGDSGQLAPNPAVDVVRWTRLGASASWTAHQPNGAVIATGRGPFIEVGSWPQGVYLLRSGSDVQRLVVTH
jgi:hypothetical protein